MKVKDVIKFLQTCDPEIEVVVDGYEDGFDIARDPKIIKVVFSKSEHHWSGDYSEVKDHELDFKGSELLSAVLLGRVSN